MQLYNIENDFAVVQLNVKLYDLETIYSAAYQVLDDLYIYFDGERDSKISVHISHKDEKKNNEKGLDKAVKEFMNQLINYTYYKINTKRKESLRALFLKKSFDNINLAESDGVYVDDYSEDLNKVNLDSDNASEECKEQENSGKEETAPCQETNESNDDFEFDDPDGIAVPWEEKYGEENGN